MRHALADLERGVGGCNPKLKKSDKTKQKKRRNEKRKGKIEKVLNVCLICVCAHFYYVILYLYNFFFIFSLNNRPLWKISGPASGHVILFSKYFKEMCIKLREREIDYCHVAFMSNVHKIWHIISSCKSILINKLMILKMNKMKCKKKKSKQVTIILSLNNWYTQVLSFIGKFTYLVINIILLPLKKYDIYI